MHVCARLTTPIGDLILEGDDEGLTAVRFTGSTATVDAGTGSGSEDQHPVLTAAARQLEEYFAGTRTVFDVPLRPSGTPFQHAVWSALAEIPYGQTWTYRALAVRLGRPSATRAVGAACGRNPLPVVVPCHRVVGTDGSLTGYAGGTWTKEALLTLETPTLVADPLRRTLEEGNDAWRPRAPLRMRAC